MAFNLEVMEEELTCPVCLELYRDPLILPCSHSMCRRCLEEILDSRPSRHGTGAGFECPSCRQFSDLTRDRLVLLPKNLALENVVLRFVDERRKSVVCSVDAGTPAHLPRSASLMVVSGAGDHRSTCDLCDSAHGVAPAGQARWHCVQCDVAYCQPCLDRYHPRRGGLARHRVCSAVERCASAAPTTTAAEGAAGGIEPAHCADHEAERSTMFCDRCKVCVCHLCVCDGEGRHAGHKMLAPDTACAMVKALANRTKEQSDGLLAGLLDEQTRIDAYYSQVNDLHKSSCARIEQQYQRLVDDLTSALCAEKRAALARVDDTRARVRRQSDTQRADSERCGRLLSELSRACQVVATETGGMEGILGRAAELQPLAVRMRRHRKEVGMLHKRFESMLKDKSSKLQLLSSTEQFRKRIDKVLSWFLDDGISGCDSIIPHILTSLSACAATGAASTAPLGASASPGGGATGAELVPSRVHSKYLTTWGFSSTSFTGESLSRSCSWTVTVEPNSAHGPLTQTPAGGFLFGVGVATEALGSKDVVGMTPTSHGVVARGTSVTFSHAGRHDVLATLDALPVSVTVAVRAEPNDVTVFTYKLASVVEGRRVSLVGRRVIRDPALRAAMYPVFTVSRRVRILFPTYV